MKLLMASFRGSDAIIRFTERGSGTREHIEIKFVRRTADDRDHRRALADTVIELKGID
jgi:hypothetical protein